MSPLNPIFFGREDLSGDETNFQAGETLLGDARCDVRGITYGIRRPLEPGLGNWCDGFYFRG